MSEAQLLKQILEELKPRDLVGEDKKTVGTTQTKIRIEVTDFREIKVKPDGDAMQISFREIKPDTYTVDDGEIYILSKKERDKVIREFYAQAVTKEATLWITYWL